MLTSAVHQITRNNQIFDNFVCLSCGNLSWNQHENHPPFNEPPQSSI